MRDRLILLLFSLFFIGLSVRSASSAETLQLLTLDYPPYEYSENGEVKGLAVNVVREVFRRLNYKVEIKALPWTRSLKLVELGQADAIFTAYRTPERELFLDYSNEILMSQEVSLFIRKGFHVPQDHDFTNLAKYHFGARRGVSYGAKFDKAVEEGTLQSVYRVSDGNALIKLLINKRVDIVPFNRLGGYYRFRELGVAGDVEELSPPIQSVPSYIAFSKKRNHALLRDLVDRTLIEMRQDGSYDRLTDYSLVN
ncbi:MAG: transporter substrate-binding domain-containing protein [Halopseudomonas aestusnigri]